MQGAEIDTEIKSLGDFHEDVIRFELDEFIGEHGRAFLVHHGPLGKMQFTREKKKTLVFENPAVPAEGTFSPEADYLVFPLHAGPLMDGFGETISIGRSEVNDVVIPDASVSAFHAFAQVEPGGSLRLQDMNSTNGTFINGQRVPSQDSGDPLPLRSGDRVRLGSVTLTCLMAKEFRNLVNGLLG